MKTFPWHEAIVPARFWDVDAHNGRGQELTKEGTVRSLLENIGQQKYEDTLRNCTVAIVMLMDQVENLSRQNDDLQRQISRIQRGQSEEAQ